jgi:hypothetical protein
MTICRVSDPTHVGFVDNSQRNQYLTHQYLGDVPVGAALEQQRSIPLDLIGVIVGRCTDATALVGRPARSSNLDSRE